MCETIPRLLESRESHTLALRGESEAEWSTAELIAFVDSLARGLSAEGMERHHRIALVTRNGPVAALAFLAASTVAVAAPLNPAYTQAELEFALGDLPARMLLTDGTSPAAIAAARVAGIRVLMIDETQPASGLSRPKLAPAQPGDVALVLHTSGTTGRPKRVPLTHANVTASAKNIAASLALSPTDRCLNVMPLFHIHGLIGCLLASLHAGGSIVCTSGFDAFKFFGALEASRPTWYSAVPTMHQAILSRARNGEAPRHQLRFARSASSALPAVVASGIEALFAVPLIEAYGMTEAAHQIAANPLPPAARKPGSVGLPSGVEVAAFADDGTPLPPGARGEVGIRGASVTDGYEGIDSATVTFPGGWLRTGDEGEIDADGYVWLTGRIKEIINRGGEKVSPAEVEGVLLQHPSVSQAVVFAVPHATLGQDVGAAVVPAEGAPAIEPAELRTFAAESLARFKVPRKILVVDAIPLGPTGKPQRTTMAARLGLE